MHSEPLLQPGFSTRWQTINYSPRPRAEYYEMRPWQKEAYAQLVSEQRLIINAPTATGKSFAICAISYKKLVTDPTLRCIITVPQGIIGKGFNGANLILPDGAKVNWATNHDLCDEKANGTIDGFIAWLSQPRCSVSLPDRVLVCTHQTFVLACNRLKQTGRLDLLRSLLLWIDEAHHLQNTEIDSDVVMRNKVGRWASYICSLPDCQIGLCTATPFRSDGGALLPRDVEDTFVRFELPWDEAFKHNRWLQKFSFDFVLCGQDYTKAFRVLAEEQHRDVVFLPYVGSSYSSKDKKQEVENIIGHYKVVRKSSELLAEDADGIQVLDNADGSTTRILDLVEDNTATRSRRKRYVYKKINETPPDLILTLGMFKEGADCKHLDRGIVVSSRNLTEIIQIMGRILRDAPNKTHAKLVMLLPFSLDQKRDDFRDNLRNYLNAILASMILENVLTPVPITARPDDKPREPTGPGPKKPWEQLLRADQMLEIFESAKDLLLEFQDTMPEVTVKELRQRFDEVMPVVLEPYGVEEYAEQIADRVWKMCVRRSLALDGIDMNDVDFDVLKEVHPLRFLMHHTAHIGINTFQQLRDAISSNNAAQNKRELLEMARRNEPRPPLRGNRLGRALVNYTCVSSECYDSDFARQIKEAAPHWFVDTAAENKKLLFEMARRGEPRPTMISNKKLASALHSYTCATAKTYDPEFAQQIKEAAPHWFVDTTAENKKVLLEMARSGEPRPSSKKNKLGKALVRYTSPKSNQYDAEFHKALKELAPHWFADTAAENKKLLFEMARRGEPRPTVKSNKMLALALGNYTRESSESYDPDFARRIRKAAPKWYIDTAAENKKLLLALAQRNGPKPHWKSKLGRALADYICPTASYDPEFEKQIREAAPHWFIDTAAENRRLLLELAERNEPRPHWQTQLGRALIEFTNKRMSGSDFHKQIREAAPHWFIDTAAENKKLLLEMARKDEPRPKDKSKLGQVLKSYINPSHKCYDPEFRDRIREAAPHWFKDSADNKTLLLEMARRSDPRPTLRGGKLGRALVNYTCVSSKSYDPEFTQQIRRLAPQWFKK